MKTFEWGRHSDEAALSSLRGIGAEHSAHPGSGLRAAPLSPLRTAPRKRSSRKTWVSQKGKGQKSLSSLFLLLQKNREEYRSEERGNSGLFRLPLSGPRQAGKFQFRIDGPESEESHEAVEVHEAQIAFILQQAEEGTAVGEVCRKAGISEATFYVWRKKYAGLMPSEMKRLRQLEEENGKLKRIVADLSLDKAMLQDVVSAKTLKPARRRRAGRRGASDLAGVDPRAPARRCGSRPSTYHYKCRRGDQAALRKRIREIAETRVRYGYRRIHVLLRREGWAGQREAGLPALPRDGPAAAQQDAEAAGEGEAARRTGSAATRSNETWAMDFVHDQLATGRKLRVLTIVDTFSRFSPAIEPRFSFRGADVVEVLERVGGEVGFPAVHPGRPGHRVHLPRSRSVGLPARRHARLLPPRQADRQCLHRKPERQVPRRVPERPLVPEP